MRTISLLLLSTFFLGGCTSVYYDALEQVGIEKRHILAGRVEDGRDDQKAAQEQFQTTFEAFQALTGYSGGELETVYESLSDEFEACEERADAVRSRIGSIESVAGDLFEEWEFEIAQISDAKLRGSSKENLAKTRGSYASLVSAMKSAAGRMDPVLTAFRDRVLYLKHNLNATAVVSLSEDLGEIESDVGDLIAEMNTAIAEADQFLGEI
jgi:hypothetical protein